MTDRELLELSAKAAGLRPGAWFDGYHDEGREKGAYWNPLTDDGDALRLLTRLPHRELYVSEIGATVSWRREGSAHGFKCDEYASEHGGALQAATRRAIVRAAAAIGQSMETQTEKNARFRRALDEMPTAAPLHPPGIPGNTPTQAD